MKLENLVGETLDEKYKIERELGKGGMGAVYLSTHIGTGRPVAVKVIVPEFMKRAEFVERFRREARAAGRLRHPNVVDVTDFGIADTEAGKVAYLVMEYLDGCTLGEILEEEKQLPLGWTLDILEQVGSAIHEAHAQGIIHRDLKPDNIWLEPNQRGGYTVKVLDFGIAKLESMPEDETLAPELLLSSAASHPTSAFNQNTTISGDASGATLADKEESATMIARQDTRAESSKTKSFDAEAGTLIQELPALSAIDSEAGTAILPLEHSAGNLNASAEAGTKLFSSPATNDKPPEMTNKPSRISSKETELTRVGSVLGTPLYMSPEQCRGERLDARSDIYSLSVIAYQMLSGKTPFAGDFTSVMQSHKEAEPPALEAKKVPKKVRSVIMSALDKNPEARPATAQAFTSELRSYSEGFGSLFQRALVIYSQHLPKFLGLAFWVYIPVMLISILQVVVSFLTASGALDNVMSGVLKVLLALGSFFLGFFCGYLILGTTTWTVAQILTYPLRPISIRSAFAEVRKKWKPLAFTGSLSSVLTLVGYSLCFLPGLALSILWALVSPVVMLENLRGKAALKRSKDLAKRSLRTTTAAVLTMFAVPILVAAIVAFIASATVKSLSVTPPASPAAKTATVTENKQPDKPIVISTDDNKGGFNVTIGDEADDESGDKKDMGRNLRMAVREGLMQILMLPLSILIGSFSAVVIALLYLKTRQAGGESMQDLLTQFEESDEPQSNWQRRVRQRLTISKRLTGKSSADNSRRETGNITG